MPNIFTTWDVLYLIGEVDGGVHDAGAVGADRVCDVPDADRVEVLVVALRLHEDLPREEREVGSADHASILCCMQLT